MSAKKRDRSPKSTPDILDFEVPTTAEDIEVLRQLRHQGPRDFAEYLA